MEEEVGGVFQRKKLEKTLEEEEGGEDVGKQYWKKSLDKWFGIRD